MIWMSLVRSGRLLMRSLAGESLVRDWNGLKKKMEEGRCLDV